MAVDWPCREREQLANDFPGGDLRGLFSDRQATGHSLSLDLKFEHELLAGHRGALPSAIQHVLGVLAGGQRASEAEWPSHERHIDGRREGVTRCAEARDRRDYKRAFHVGPSLFASFGARMVRLASQHLWFVT